MNFTCYKDAADYQLREWTEGRPWHNPWSPGADKPDYATTGGECCPDFSCCVPSMIWARERRYAFVEANDENREGMLFGALSGLVADHNAYVIGDKE
jgi:hypothetical protein